MDETGFLVAGLIGLVLAIIHFLSLARIATATMQTAKLLGDERAARAQMASDLERLRRKIEGPAA